MPCSVQNPPAGDGGGGGGGSEWKINFKKRRSEQNTHTEKGKRFNEDKTEKEEEGGEGG